MNQNSLTHHALPVRGLRPRILVLAVLAALPGAIYAQTLPALQVDPRLLGSVESSAPDAAQSVPAGPGDVTTATGTEARGQSSRPVKNSVVTPREIGGQQVPESPPSSPDFVTPAPVATQDADAQSPVPAPRAAAQEQASMVTEPSVPAVVAAEQQVPAEQDSDSGKKSPAPSMPDGQSDAAVIAAPGPRQPAQPGPGWQGEDALSVATEPKRASMLVVPKGSDGQPDSTRSTHVDADQIGGRDQVDMTAYGAVHLTRENMVLDSDQLYYDQIANEVSVEGNVHFKHGSDTMDGTRAQINLDTWYGEFDKPVYSLQRVRKLRNDVWPVQGQAESPSTELVKGSGHADVAYLEGENHYRLTNSTYTTCPAPDPSWYLRIRRLKLDLDRDKGESTGATLVFKDVPIAYMPWAEFPLSGGRQSGFLPPTLGATNSTGLDVTVPYYFNIAPNYDFTLSPRYMSDRGMQIGGEFRYLSSSSQGKLSSEYLDEDTLTHDSRYMLSWQHSQNLGYGFSGGIDATQVSDKTYFADLSSKIVSTSQSTLTQQANLAYSGSDWFSSNLLVQRYQVLSGDAPYNRMPQLTINAGKSDLYGFDVKLPIQYTNFTHPTSDEGRRTILYPQISYPIESSSYFLTPKVGVHYANYDIRRHSTLDSTQITTTIPTVSLDAGLIFERDTSIGGQAQIQTLEPRIYYVHTPYHDQSQIPVFDTALADFNFAQIFSENRYVGNDRVADANQVTAGVESKMISAATGEEWLRTALAQRYYFSDQEVTIPGETVRSGRVANVLGSVAGRVVKNVWLDNTVEYEPRDGSWERASTQLRYQPGATRTMSVAYRYERDEYRDLDFAAQWPLWGKLYGVGRYDLNLRDHRLSEAIAGVEYQGDCWVLRTVWQSLLTSSETRNTSFYIQLEFNGLASLGNNPVNLLRRSISGYGKINEE